MANYLRKNAWDANNGGQFQDQSGNYTELYWYAKAVQVMQSRPVNDAASWWFYAAIHAELLITQDQKDPYLNWQNISYIPQSARLDTLPSSGLIDLFWNQCQHATWFFPPWHRGYLVALENILRDIIVNQLNGPADWALPYWNYLNQSAQYGENYIPPAFTVAQLPDGTTNPLFVPERYGIGGDGVIYVQASNSDDPKDYTHAHDKCQWDTIYSETSPPPANPGTPGDLYGYFYGGKETGFWHGDVSGGHGGDLEDNPHNHVHVMIGGKNKNNNQYGLMAVNETAALDPVFFLHHANIDRMWAAWNITGKNNNPNDPNWLAGPSAQGHSRFAMPLDSKGTPWYFTPKDVQDITNLAFNGSIYSYSYDDLSLTSYEKAPPPQLHKSLSRRLVKLTGAAHPETSIQMANNKIKELVGASSKSLALNSGTTETTVKLDTSSWKSVRSSLLNASASNLPDEIFLHLEGVKGNNDANFLSVFVNEVFVKSVALFGLRMASRQESADGGSGLSFNFNITNIIDDLHLNHSIDIDSLNVQIKTEYPIHEGSKITVGRIGIYRLSR